MSQITVQCDTAFHAFRLEADFSIKLDGVTAIFGPSGSGKTTLLRVIAGLLHPKKGLVVLDGEIWQDTEHAVFVPPWHRRIGYVFQETRLFPHLSVAGNIAYGARRRRSKQQRLNTDQVIAILGLDRMLARRTWELSGGERQRVAIARALLASPRLLLMDEPVSALDADAKEEILPFIQRTAETFRIPILYVSHAIDEVLRLASQIVVVDRGRIAAAGPLMELSNRLDLSVLASRMDAGSVIAATVAGHEPATQITRLGFAGGELIAPAIDLAVGTPMNLRIRARDVAIALSPPDETSILNIVEGTIVEIERDHGPHAHVLLDVGCPLWARIMRKSVDDLGLAPGRKVYALLKAVAVDQRSIGRPTSMERALTRGR